MSDESVSGGEEQVVATAAPAPVPVVDAPVTEPIVNLPVPVADYPRRPNLAALLLGALLVAAVWFPLQCWNLGSAAFHTKGEPREALMVQSIVRDGEWALPRRNVVELPAKPPLFHWLGALASRAHGTINEGTVRLPSAVCSLGAALIVFVTGAIAWSVTAGLAAALTLMTSFEWLRAATSARVDMTHSLGLTAAMCGLLILHLRGGGRAYWLVALGSAWAVLSKGPVGLALPLLLLIAMSVVDRSTRLLRATHIVRVVFLVGVVAAIWYGLAFMEGGSGFFQKQILTENLWRFVGTSRFTEGHRHGVGYLFGVLLAGLLPWTLLLPSIGAALWRNRRMTGRHDPQTFLLVWIVVVFAFFSFASSKRGVYLLALYPPVFLLLGWWLHTTSESVISRLRLARALPPIAWVLAWLFGGVALISALAYWGFPIANAIPDLLGTRAARDARPVILALSADARLATALFTLAAIGAGGAALVAAQQRWGLMLTLLLVSSVAVSVAARSIVMPAVAHTVSRRPFNESLRAIAGADGDIAAYRSFDYGSVFYWGTPVPVQTEPLNASSPPILVTGDEAWARATPMERRLYQRVPFVESPRGGNIGRLIVLQRRPASSEPAVPPPS